VRLAERRLALLDWIESALCTVDIRQRIRLESLRNVAACAVRTTQAWVAESHVDQRLLVMIASKVVHLLALQLILNAFAVWSITD
jgi:hypothetical protein